MKALKIENFEKIIYSFQSLGNYFPQKWNINPILILEKITYHNVHQSQVLPMK